MKPTARTRKDRIRVREAELAPTTIEIVPEDLALKCNHYPTHDDMDDPAPCNLNEPICYTCHRIFWQTGAAQRATELAARLNLHGSNYNVRWHSKCSRCIDAKAPWRWLGGELGYRSSTRVAHATDRELADCLPNLFLWHLRALILDYVGDECAWIRGCAAGRAENSQDVVEYQKVNERRTKVRESQCSISMFFKKV